MQQMGRYPMGNPMQNPAAIGGRGGFSMGQYIAANPMPVLQKHNINKLLHNNNYKHNNEQWHNDKHN